MYLPSMHIPLYQVDAFTDKVFKGNPACVMLLDDWLEEDVLLAIAQENAVAETAFLVPQAQGFHLRWFTPDLEMDLCGHATLASAHVVLHHLHPELNEVTFDSLSGPLVVTRSTHGYEMTLPNRAPEHAILPVELEESLSTKPVEVHKSRDYLLVYNHASEVENLHIQRDLFDRIQLGTGGVIVTAPGEDCDFVSRFFTPQATILEDPVTGSAHCTSAPYWSERLGQTQLVAEQRSARGGTLHCQVLPLHVLVSGQARTYLQGNVELNHL